eukprot:705638-Amphidinium_carterae.3
MSFQAVGKWGLGFASMAPVRATALQLAASEEFVSLAKRSDWPSLRTTAMNPPLNLALIEHHGQLVLCDT